MSVAYYASVTLHILAALLWLGGMLFIAAVGAPVLRRIESVPLRRDLFGALGRRFRLVGWISILVLLGTGVLNLQFRGLLQMDTLGSGAFWATRLGRALGWKLLGVSLMLVMSVLHDFVYGPAASRLDPSSARATSTRRTASWIARANALVGVGVVFAAAVLARG